MDKPTPTYTDIVNIGSDTNIISVYVDFVIEFLLVTIHGKEHTENGKVLMGR